MLKNRFLDRLLMTTSVFTDAGDTGGGSAPAADPGPSASDGSPAGVGGAQEQDHDFGYSYDEPSQEETARVASILDPAKDQDRSLGYGEIGALLGWNPSLKPAAKAPDASAPQPQAPAQAPAAPAQAPQTQAPAQPQAPALDPNIQALTQSVQALVQTQTQAQPSAQPTAPTQPKRFYGDINQELQVAPELVSAIIGSNQPEAVAQAAPAINHLINGLANKVMEDAVRVIQHQYQQVLQHIPQAVQAHTTERTNSQKFYDRYAELNKPAFQPLVNQAGQAYVAKLQKEGKQIVYDDSFFDAVGGLVHAYIEQSMGFKLPRAARPAVAAAPASIPQTAPKPRFVTPQGTRPPAGPSGSSQSADLRDLV